MTTDTTTTTDPTPQGLTGSKITHRLLYPGRCGGFNQWVRALADELLNSPPPPREAILSHHGLHFNFRGLTLSLAPFEDWNIKGQMVISLARPIKSPDWKRAHGRDGAPGFKARTWKCLRAAAALAFGGTELHHWNGGDDNTSTSMVIATPAGLRWMEGLVANYRSLADCFHMTPEEQTRAKMAADWQLGLGGIMNVRHRWPRPTYHKITKAEIEVGHGPDKGKRLKLEGQLFSPADFPPADRAKEYAAAVARVFNTAQAYFPRGERIGITFYPNPQQ